MTAPALVALLLLAVGAAAVVVLAGLGLRKQLAENHRRIGEQQRGGR